MIVKEKRKHIRVNSVHLINYIYYDEESKEEAQGMGRTLNISESGLLLETKLPLKTQRKVSLNIGLEEEILPVSGMVIFTNDDESGMSKSGVRIIAIEDNKLNVLKNHIQSSGTGK